MRQDLNKEEQVINMSVPDDSSASVPSRSSPSPNHQAATGTTSGDKDTSPHASPPSGRTTTPDHSPRHDEPNRPSPGDVEKDDVNGDDLSRENGKSAFEITSVRAVPEDELDNSMVRSYGTKPTSTDVETMKDVRKSTISESSLESSSETKQNQETEEDGSSEKPALVAEESSVLPPSPSLEQAPPMEEVVTKQGPPGSGPTRFRFVNKFVRSRWTVCERVELEERPDEAKDISALSQSELMPHVHVQRESVEPEMLLEDALQLPELHMSPIVPRNRENGPVRGGLKSGEEDILSTASHSRSESEVGLHSIPDTTNEENAEKNSIVPDSSYSRQSSTSSLENTDKSDGEKSCDGNKSLDGERLADGEEGRRELESESLTSLHSGSNPSDITYSTPSPLHQSPSANASQQAAAGPQATGSATDGGSTTVGGGPKNGSSATNGSSNVTNGGSSVTNGEGAVDRGDVILSGSTAVLQGKGEEKSVVEASQQQQGRVEERSGMSSAQGGSGLQKGSSVTVSQGEGGATAEGGTAMAGGGVAASQQQQGAVGTMVLQEGEGDDRSLGGDGETALPVESSSGGGGGTLVAQVGVGEANKPATVPVSMNHQEHSPPAPVPVPSLPSSAFSLMSGSTLAQFIASTATPGGAASANTVPVSEELSSKEQKVKHALSHLTETLEQYLQNDLKEKYMKLMEKNQRLEEELRHCRRQAKQYRHDAEKYRQCAKCHCVVGTDPVQPVAAPSGSNLPSDRHDGELTNSRDRELLRQHSNPNELPLDFHQQKVEVESQTSIDEFDQKHEFS